MAILVPTSALSNVDLPTFVRPTRTAKPAFSSMPRNSTTIFGHALTNPRRAPRFSCCVRAELIQIRSAMTWKEKLKDRIAPDLAQEIDIYETQMELRKLGKIDEKLFAETRMRRGAYGQRYDNGQRHGRVKTQQLKYPQAGLTKGPATKGYAPGTQHMKTAVGGLDPEH